MIDDKLAKLDAAATPPPWTAVSTESEDSTDGRIFHKVVSTATAPRKWVANTGTTGDGVEHDGRLIAAVRNALPALLEVARCADAAAERWAIELSRGRVTSCPPGFGLENELQDLAAALAHLKALDS